MVVLWKFQKGSEWVLPQLSLGGGRKNHGISKANPINTEQSRTLSTQLDAVQNCVYSVALSLKKVPRRRWHFPLASFVAVIAKAISLSSQPSFLVLKTYLFFVALLTLPNTYNFHSVQIMFRMHKINLNSSKWFEIGQVLLWTLYGRGNGGSEWH